MDGGSGRRAARIDRREMKDGGTFRFAGDAVGFEEIERFFEPFVRDGS